MASNSITLLFTLLMIKSIEMRILEAVEEGEGWIVGCPSSGAFACGGGGHLY